MKPAFLALALVITLTAVPAVAAADQDGPIVDSTVKLKRFVDLEYPVSARRSGLQGVVVVQVTLDDRGNVTDAAALSGRRPLIEAALPNARQWKFEPNPQKAAIIVYAFMIDPDGKCQDDSRTLFRLMHFNHATITACTPASR